LRVLDWSKGDRGKESNDNGRAVSELMWCVGASFWLAETMTSSSAGLEFSSAVAIELEGLGWAMFEHGRLTLSSTLFRIRHLPSTLYVQRAPMGITYVHVNFEAYRRACVNTEGHG